MLLCIRRWQQPDLDYSGLHVKATNIHHMAFYGKSGEGRDKAQVLDKVRSDGYSLIRIMLPARGSEQSPLTQRSSLNQWLALTKIH